MGFAPRRRTEEVDMAAHVDTMTAAALPDLEGVCNCLAVRKSARYLTAAYDKRLAPSGLRITQFTILYKLTRLGPMTIKRLAGAMAMDRTTLATNLKPLERDGLLATSTGEDRREKAIRITDVGRAKLEAAVPFWTDAQRRFEGAYGATAAAQLRSALGRILDTALDPWAE
jgi:DNA-binding MarR family transcriptional regulator